MGCNFGCCFPCCCCGCQSQMMNIDMKVINKCVNEPGSKAMFNQTSQAMVNDEPVLLDLQFNNAAPKVKHYEGDADIYLKIGKYGVSYNATLTSTVDTTTALQVKLGDVMMAETLQEASILANEKTNISGLAYLDVTQSNTKINIMNMSIDPVTLTNLQVTVRPLT